MSHNQERDLFGQINMDKEPEIEDGEVTLTLIILGEFEKTVNVCETEGGKVVTLPLSQVTIHPTGKRTSSVGKPKYAIAEISMPEWIAKDRGLI